MTRHLDEFRYRPEVVVEVPHPRHRSVPGNEPERYPSALPLHTSRTYHDWSNENKVVMLCAVRWLKIGWTQLAKLLNAYFATTEFNRRMVHTYFWNMKNLNGNPINEKVFGEIFHDVEFARPMPDILSRLQRLQDVSRSVGVNAARKAVEDFSLLTLKTNRNKRARSQSTSPRPTRRRPRPEFSQTTRQALRERGISVQSNQTHFLPAERDGPEMVEISDDEDISESSDSAAITSSSDNVDGEREDIVYSSPGLENQWLRPTPLEDLRALSEALPSTTDVRRLQRSALPEDFPSESDPVELLEDVNCPPLVFRLYTEKSAGTNSPQGFRAGLFDFPNARPATPPPEDSSLFHHFTANHIGQRKLASPFISVTPSLAWIFHRASKLVRDGVRPEDIFISTVDGLAVNNKTSVWHAEPQYNAVKGHPGLFDKDKAYYKGTAEWLVWGYIHESSIISTRTFAEVQNENCEDPAIASVLRLDVFTSNWRMRGVHRVFSKQALKLSSMNEVGFARILLLFNITPLSALHIIEELVYAIFQGWNITSSNQTSEKAFGQWVFQYSDMNQDWDQAKVVQRASAAKVAFISGCEAARADLKKGGRSTAPSGTELATSALLAEDESAEGD